MPSNSAEKFYLCFRMVQCVTFSLWLSLMVVRGFKYFSVLYVHVYVYCNVLSAYARLLGHYGAFMSAAKP